MCKLCTTLSILIVLTLENLLEGFPAGIETLCFFVYQSATRLPAHYGNRLLLLLSLPLSSSNANTPAFDPLFQLEPRVKNGPEGNFTV